MSICLLVTFKDNNILYKPMHISFKDNNILELRFDGFSERFNDFITEIWKRIRSFIPTEECFKIIKEKMQREFTSRDLVEQAAQLLSNTLFEDNITLDEKCKVLKNVTFEDVEHLRFPSKICIVGVCSGKLSREESEEILRVFEATGHFKIPNELRKKVLEPGIPWQIHAKPETEIETNSLAKVYFQMSCKKDEFGRETAFLVIIQSAIHEYLYHQLRLKERLGYAIDSSIHLDSGIRGFSVHVVSSSQQPENLLDRIYTFVATIGDFLEGVDESCFESYRLRSYNLLPLDAGICDELIYDESRIEGRLRSAYTFLGKIKKEEVIGFCKDFFTKELCRSIQVCIATGAASDHGEE